MKRYIGATENEIFLGNTRTDGGVPCYLAPLKTARIGKQALDIDGDKIDPEYMRPLFVDRSELDTYNRIMETRMSASRKGDKK